MHSFHRFKVNITNLLTILCLTTFDIFAIKYTVPSVYLDKDRLTFQDKSSVGWNGRGQWFADVTGDGRSDYIYTPDGTKNICVIPSTDSGFGNEVKWAERFYDVNFDSQWMIDFFNLGKDDYVFNPDKTKDYYVMQSTGSHFSREVQWNRREFDIGNGQWIIDLNGDGKFELIYNRKGTREYWLANYPLKDIKTTSRKNDVAWDGRGQWFADVTGNGKLDYIYTPKGKKELWVIPSTDNGFGNEVKWAERIYDVNFDSQWMIDFDGDGKTDYVYNPINSNYYHVMLSDGNHFILESKWVERKYDIGNGQWLIDINGDGKFELIYNQKGTREYWMAGSESRMPPDIIIGTRRNDVGWNGSAQWFADVTGDGRLDYIYNSNGTRKYFSMFAKQMDPDTFTILITADPQYDYEKSKGLSEKTNKRQIDVMNSLLQNVKLWPVSVGGDRISRPLFVIVNGDLTTYYKEYQRAKYKSWFEENLEYYIFPGLGNHDYANNVNDCCCGCYKSYGLNLNGLIGAFSDCSGDPFCKEKNYAANKAVKDLRNTIYGSNHYFCKWMIQEFDKLSNSVSYSFNIGSIHFIQLNNNPKYENKNIGISRSFDYLQRSLCQQLDRRTTVINMHDFGETMAVADTDFYNAINKQKITAIFAGHMHDSFGLQGSVPNTDIPYFRSGAPVSLNGITPVEKFLLVKFDPDSMTVGVISYNDSTVSFLDEQRGNNLDKYPLRY